MTLEVSSNLYDSMTSGLGRASLSLYSHAGSVPAVAAMLSTSPTRAFLWALFVPRAGQQLLGGERLEGEGLLCSLEGLGAFLPQEPCFGHHGMGSVPRQWGRDTLALQSTVTKCLSWTFSPLSPG